MVIAAQDIAWCIGKRNYPEYLDTPRSEECIAGIPSFNASLETPSILACPNPLFQHGTCKLSTFPMLLYPLSNQPGHVPSFHVNIRVSLRIIRAQELEREQHVAFDEVDVDQVHRCRIISGCVRVVFHRRRGGGEADA